jgi:hypothetical protein
VESQSVNILQVLRYGQIYGSYKYSDLDSLYRKTGAPSQALKSAHLAKFEVELQEKDFNRKQVFVVMTNGVDYRTREAIKYWRSTGLEGQAVKNCHGR